MDRLFKLIPRIQETKNFRDGIGEDVVYAFTDLMYELKLVVNFDWRGWTEGRKIVTTGNYENLDRTTLIKIITAIIRNDRFCEGVLVNSFENGTIEKLLLQLKKVPST